MHKSVKFASLKILYGKKFLRFDSVARLIQFSDMVFISRSKSVNITWAMFMNDCLEMLSSPSFNLPKQLVWLKRGFAVTSKAALGHVGASPPDVISGLDALRMT